MIYFLSIVCVSAFSFSAGERYAEELDNVTREEATESVEADNVLGNVPKEGRETADIVESVLPSVVGVAAIGEGEDEWRMGSGVIVSEKGYILTNRHVVGDEAEIMITFSDGSVSEAELVWSDRTLDSAVLKSGSAAKNAAVMGDAEKLRTGDDVLAIGNPLSMQFERSVTKGIVSAVGRCVSVEIEGEEVVMEDLIQTDASINPGNSGGPLINNEGEVVGINSVRVDAEGMGFAVPINVSKAVIAALEKDEKFETPYAGMYVYGAETAKYLRKKDFPSSGVYVAKLDVKGPAYEAGLRYGDVIKKVDGENVDTTLKLREKLYSCGAGKSTIFSVKRGDETYEFEIVLEVRENGETEMNT
ncbi:MAG: trypsin-like peptidase domain-containing protein [Clostridia bacterium]|nr:trypsin-like peptidase domain-containing protein [Clostridia bacterium]